MKTFEGIDLKNYGKKYQGKVRDWYVKGDKRILITTDRISAFDRILGLIPYKGQVLNQLAAFWFEKTKDIIPNHIITVPDPNVVIVKNCEPILVEMVVRGYMTGVTVTAIWPSYLRGERIIYGVEFPDGIHKNQKLPHPVITPTYHGDITGKGGHDTRLTKEEIVKKKIVPKEIYEQMEQVALRLFERGTKICKNAGIILVDTKYEFGLIDRKLVLMDEIHTPDSSRFWIKKTYKERFKKSMEPENFDKEFLRIWYKNQGYTGDGVPPKMTKDFIEKVSKRYMAIYKKITGKKFTRFDREARRVKPTGSIEKRIEKNIKNYFKPKLAVLVSNGGTGTNLQAIIDGVKQKKINATVEIVVSDTKDAYGLTRAKKNNIKTAISPTKEELLDILKKYDVDYICLAGWKQYLIHDVMEEYKNKIINLHPGLIPDKVDKVVKNPDGTNALWNKKKLQNKALQNYFDNNATYAGASIHILTNEVDFGPVLGRVFEKIKKKDTIGSLYARLKKKENSLYVKVLKNLFK